jgi:YjbE family integral membrane protein
MIELFSAVVGILLVNLALSGDNALVIGAAATGLPRRQRWIAIFSGGAAATILRLVFASVASFLLALPWLQAVGGLILLLIAIRLLADRNTKRPSPGEQTTPHTSETPDATTDTKRRFLPAMLTILVADVSMSLDNVLAVGALSHGNLLVLSLGLLVSMIILLIGSGLVAELMRWLPWLLDVAALVLAWTGANMMLNDLQLGDFLNNYSWTAIAVPAVSFGIVLGADVLLRLRTKIPAQRS